MLSGDGLIPVAGDFDGDGTTTAGLYDQQSGTFYVRDSAGSGFAETEARFGRRSRASKPVIGDWDGNGTETLGIYDSARGTFSLKNDLMPGTADIVFRFGPRRSPWLPVAGDFDGDGDDDVGLYNRLRREFHLKFDETAGPADLWIRFGPVRKQSVPVVGDWNGDGKDTVGVYLQEPGRVFLRNAKLPSKRDHVFSFGPRGQQTLPLSGDWDGDGDDTIGVYSIEQRQFLLKDKLSAGRPNQVVYVAPMLDPSGGGIAPAAFPELLSGEVTTLLSTAAGVSATEDAIIAVVDRGGTILGVRAEGDALAAIPDTATLVFAVDGAVAKARTAAFFANESGIGAPITSRTVRFISQSTITQREAESNPNHCDPAVASFDARTCGPGFVAPIGLGGHFPPEIAHTPHVDLFAIEHTNRDSIVHPGPDGVRQPVTLDAMGDVMSVSGDDILLPNRFNVADAFVVPGAAGALRAPESFGFQSGLLPNAQSRGIGTLPGGVPLYRDNDGDGLGDVLVGGIGVFFPGPDGFATHEQGFVPRTPVPELLVGYVGQTEADRTNAPKVLEAESIAAATAAASPVTDIRLPLVDFTVAPPRMPRIPLEGRLTLVGIELEVFGPHPDGLWKILEMIDGFGAGGDPGTGMDLSVEVGGATAKDGEPVPSGFIVAPHGSGVDDLTTADVTKIITDAIAEAELVRAAIRLPRGSRTRMVFAVADTSGEVLGLFRMPDATIFSIDVAVAKARNTAYYADAAAIVDPDRVDLPTDGVPDLPPGIAFSNRTFRYLAEPRFPSGVDGLPSGPFSILNDVGINPLTAENVAAALPFTAYVGAGASVLANDAFRPATNFRDPDDIANQNGIVFFPGSTPLYNSQALVGGFGVSGDGVDQDDVVTFFGANDFLPPTNLRADQVFVLGVRLPFQKFLRNPEG
jgi:uncharacterized protein GlcG (DUF336 family)